LWLWLYVGLVVLGAGFIVLSLLVTTVVVTTFLVLVGANTPGAVCDLVMPAAAPCPLFVPVQYDTSFGERGFDVQAADKAYVV